jgi:hypothetical protein
MQSSKKPCEPFGTVLFELMSHLGRLYLTQSQQSAGLFFRKPTFGGLPCAFTISFSTSDSLKYDPKQ